MKLNYLAAALFILSTNTYAGFTCSGENQYMKISIEEYEYRSNNYLGIYYSGQNGDKDIVANLKEADVYESNENVINIQTFNTNQNYNIKLNYDYSLAKGALAIFPSTGHKWGLIISDLFTCYRQ